MLVFCLLIAAGLVDADVDHNECSGTFKCSTIDLVDGLYDTVLQRCLYGHSEIDGNCSRPCHFQRQAPCQCISPEEAQGAVSTRAWWTLVICVVLTGVSAVCCWYNPFPPWIIVPMMFEKLPEFVKEQDGGGKTGIQKVDDFTNMEGGTSQGAPSSHDASSDRELGLEVVVGSPQTNDAVAQPSLVARATSSRLDAAVSGSKNRLAAVARNSSDGAASCFETAVACFVLLWFSGLLFAGIMRLVEWTWFQRLDYFWPALWVILLGVFGVFTLTGIVCTVGLSGFLTLLCWLLRAIRGSCGQVLLVIPMGLGIVSCYMIPVLSFAGVALSINHLVDPADVYYSCESH